MRSHPIKTALPTKAVAITCAVAMTAPAMVPLSAQAAMVGTDVMTEQSDIQSDRATINAFMARDDVRAELERQGVDPAEADARVAALSDAEARRMADTIRTAPAGQGALGAVIGAGVLIFLVLLITDILGFTDVFNFTRKGSAR